jgi:hypothetical protein
VDLTSLLLAPVRVPLRLARALDDLTAIADRARRDPDPVEEVRTRIDLLLVELAAVIAVGREIVDGGAELTDTTKSATARMIELEAMANGLMRTGGALDVTGRQLHTGGQDLLATGQQLEADTRELIDGGDRLRQVTEQMEEHLRVFRAAMPKVMRGLDTVEELEGAVETVAETVEPLQGAAERVGRVTQRFSRRSSS